MKLIMNDLMRSINNWVAADRQVILGLVVGSWHSPHSFDTHSFVVEGSYSDTLADCHTLDWGCWN